MANARKTRRVLCARTVKLCDDESVWQTLIRRTQLSRTRLRSQQRRVLPLRPVATSYFMTPSAEIQQSAIFDHMVKQIMEPQTNLIRANVADRVSEIDEIIGCYQRFGTNHTKDIERLLAEREQLTGGRIEGGAIVIGEEQ